MFFVPDEDSSTTPGWRQNRFFVADVREPILIAHVSPELSQGEAALWGFSDPNDLVTLIAGISRSGPNYRLGTLTIMFPPEMTPHMPYKTETVLSVMTASMPGESRTFVVHTVEGNSYLLGKMPSSRVRLDKTIYCDDSRAYAETA